jgi:hypothetical protein
LSICANNAGAHLARNPLDSLEPKWSKAEKARRDVGIYRTASHKAEQKKALILEPEYSTTKKLEMQLDSIISRLTF